jgi:hypothetical protein
MAAFTDWRSGADASLQAKPEPHRTFLFRAAQADFI